MTTKLTPKQRAFAENKAAGLTNRDAAIAAGYAVAAASPTATKLMAHPGVRSAIKASAPVSVATAPTMPRAKYADAMKFLCDVMNHAKLPIAMRAEAAKQLLPYQHARIGETGKKQNAKERAKDVVSTRHKFTPKKAPPQLRVVE